MEKSTLYLVTIIIVAVVILGVFGEYFTYKYALLSSQQTQQTADQKQNTANQVTSGSSEKLITSFNFQNPMAVGSIDQSNHTITVTVPPITDLTRLTPVIQVSDNASVSPSSNTRQDFTKPAAYLVTAQNGSTQEYAVTVNLASILKTAEKSITSFKLLGLNPVVVGIVDDTAHTVYAVVPDGTDLTKLAPTIGVSDGAIVFPASGAIQNFTSPVLYTVTDMYGATQNYTVTVLTESNSG